jgi:hypothetical protein
MDETITKPQDDPLAAEVQAAYSTLGIEIGGDATYGVYSRLHCKRCGTQLGMIGNKLLPGLIPRLLEQTRDLYASGSLGCACGFQAECAKRLGKAAV